ncbi:hypothetical protein CVIRNUC_009183 [Coccomyxa viridis]|uniref:5-formyltetrahydrofolate cyclo-ligase n=1 Tax=Coccomyxa viridis TaxID=1274662 RepID=A0AAV1IIC7_9CHLO|nr:hypothetical protein CVIRNUC_009183 [Coccomyxa viridis]
MFASVRQTFRTLTGPHGVWPAVSHFKKANIRMGVCAEGLQDQKKALRKEMKARLRHMSAEDMQAESDAICGHLLKAPFFTSSTRLGIYLHCAALREVDTALLVDAALHRGDAKCYVPLVLDQAANMRLLHLDKREGLTAGPPYYILEPSKQYADGQPREDVLEMKEPLDLLIMPGLAFDRKGHRCGRGGGYYDKFLSLAQLRATKLGWDPPLLVALAFQSQMVEHVPMAENDRGVDVIVIQDGAMAVSARGAKAIG